MLLIVNCKSIYGSDIADMSDALKRMGHEIAVVGAPRDRATGDFARARAILKSEKGELPAIDTVEGRRSIMLGLVSDKVSYFGEALVISDDPSDRAAADSLNIVTVSPFDFNLQWVGEEINGS